MAAILNLKIRHLNGISQEDNIRKWIQHTQIRLKKVVVDFSSKTLSELYLAAYMRNPSTIVLLNYDFTRIEIFNW